MKEAEKSWCYGRVEMLRNVEMVCKYCVVVVGIFNTIRKLSEAF